MLLIIFFELILSFQNLNSSSSWFSNDNSLDFFKRKSKLKDTGKIIPGHGGLLDRIDGLISVFPALFILVLIIDLIK